MADKPNDSAEKFQKTVLEQLSKILNRLDSLEKKMGEILANRIDPEEKQSIIRTVEPDELDRIFLPATNLDELNALENRLKEAQYFDDVVSLSGMKNNFQYFYPLAMLLLDEHFSCHRRKHWKCRRQKSHFTYCSCIDLSRIIVFDYMDWQNRKRAKQKDCTPKVRGNRWCYCIAMSNS